MMAQYDDEEMGALDCEEIEGHITLQDDEVLKLAEAYEHEKTEGIRLGREISKVVSLNFIYYGFMKCLILMIFCETMNFRQETR
jgi:hypothetical protein